MWFLRKALGADLKTILQHVTTTTAVENEETARCVRIEAKPSYHFVDVQVRITPPPTANQVLRVSCNRISSLDSYCSAEILMLILMFIGEPSLQRSVWQCLNFPQYNMMIVITHSKQIPGCTCCGALLDNRVSYPNHVLACRPHSSQGSVHIRVVYYMRKRCHDTYPQTSSPCSLTLFTCSS